MIILRSLYVHEVILTLKCVTFVTFVTFCNVTALFVTLRVARCFDVYIKALRHCL